MSVVLNVTDVGKSYRTYKSNLHRYANWFGASFAPRSEFWANRNISFQVKQGEAVALIGQNGAGKSTLLKIITGTVRPTEGSVRVTGKVSAIVELGLGFNHEFTGRQNVYQAGGMMGYSQAELTELMPQIQDFAEVGEFFDQPLRVYSSGMHARLAFALATVKCPDVLIVDEVLSVGDSYFQHKSFDRIRQFKEQGASIILVTHNMGDVRALGDRVILLDNGKVIKDGAPDEVVDYYNAMTTQRENAKLTMEQTRKKDGWAHTRSGTFDAHVEKIELVDAETETPVNAAVVAQKLAVRAEVRVNKSIPRLVFGLMLRDRTGHVVWGSNTWHTRQIVEAPKAGEIIRYNLMFGCDLGPGSYSFSTSLSVSDTHIVENYEWQDNLVVFEVVNTDMPIFIGSSFLDAEFQIVR